MRGGLRAHTGDDVQWCVFDWGEEVGEGGVRGEVWELRWEK